MGAGANPEPRRSLVSKGTKGVKEDKPSSTDFPEPYKALHSHSPCASGILGSSLADLGAMAALTASMVSCPTAPVAAKPFNGLSRSSLPCKAVPVFGQRTVSNGARTRQMLVWEPVNNK